MKFKINSRRIALAAVVATSVGAYAQLSDIPMENGMFENNWKSLEQWDCPEWFKDAKFGLWAHWGPQCQAESGDWYGRYLYYSNNPYDERRGINFNPKEYGMKDFCHDWKAENWDPNAIMKKYKAVGCKYFMALGNHHDNFDLWNSPYQEWNSVNIGPQRDIDGEWAEAARKNGLFFGVSIHASHAWLWFEIGNKYGDVALTKEDGYTLNADGTEKWWKGYDPQELYAQHHTLSAGWDDGGRIHSQWAWGNGATLPDSKYKTKLMNRCRQLVKDYSPDMIYFDDTVLPFWGCDDQWGQDFLAYYYNHMSNLNGGGDPNVVVCGKVLPEDTKESMLWDVERGIPDRPQEKYWQTCTCIGGWHYSLPDYRAGAYKSAETVIRMLIDIVSKNGNLLLSVPLRADGTYDEKEERILNDIQAWMEINGESIYGTRVWDCFGEGPLTETANGINGQGFNEGQNYTSQEVRYVHRNDTVYATIMVWPNAGDYTMKAFSPASKYYPGQIDKVELLGYGEVAFSQGVRGLVIDVPSDHPNYIAPAFRITFKDESLSEAELVESLISELGELGKEAADNCSYTNSGKYNTIKTEKLNQVVLEIKNSDLSTEEAIKDAKEKLINAYQDFEANGKNNGGLWNGKIQTNMTTDILVQGSAFTRAAGGNSRFGKPANWTVENFNIPNGGDGTKQGLDKYSGQDALMLGVWDDRASNTGGNLSNARIYRKVTLEKGYYYFGAAFNACYNMTDQAYMFVSPELCNTDEIPYISLAYLNLNQVPNDMSIRGLWVSIPEDMEVYIGFQVNLNIGSAEQEFRAEKVYFYRLAEVGLSDLQSLIKTVNTKLGTIKSKTKVYNTGFYDPEKYEEMLALVTEINNKVETMSEDEATAAYYSLEEAWETYQAEGLNHGGLLTETDGEDLTIDLLTEASSFTRDNESVTTRFAAPKYWTVENFKIPNGGDGTKQGLDKYSGQDALMLGIWDDRGNNQSGSLANARIYQKVTLEPGCYFFGAAYNANHQLYQAYMYVAEKLLLTSAVARNAMAYYNISDCGISQDMKGIYFYNDTKQELVLCFQANLSTGATQQEFRAEKITLQKLETPDYLLRISEDVNQDGVVNSLDVLKVYKFMQTSTGEETGLLIEDVNGDGVVNSLDVLKVYKYMQSH